MLQRKQLVLRALEGGGLQIGAEHILVVQLVEELREDAEMLLKAAQVAHRWRPVEELERPVELRQLDELAVEVVGQDVFVGKDALEGRAHGVWRHDFVHLGEEGCRRVVEAKVIGMGKQHSQRRRGEGGTTRPLRPAQAMRALSEASTGGGGSSSFGVLSARSARQ